MGIVDMDDVRSNAFQVGMLAPVFFPFYKSLKNIMKVREQKLLSKQSKKGPNTSSSLPILTTPETQYTHPRNPDYTGSSTQSKDEDYTKDLLSMLFMCTLIILGKGFKRLSWVQSSYEVLLEETLSLHPI